MVRVQLIKPPRAVSGLVGVANGIAQPNSQRRDKTVIEARRQFLRGGCSACHANGKPFSYLLICECVQASNEVVRVIQKPLRCFHASALVGADGGDFPGRVRPQILTLLQRF